jgi:hypothetical protein
LLALAAVQVFSQPNLNSSAGPDTQIVHVVGEQDAQEGGGEEGGQEAEGTDALFNDALLTTDNTFLEVFMHYRARMVASLDDFELAAK